MTTGAVLFGAGMYLLIVQACFFLLMDSCTPLWVLSNVILFYIEMSCYGGRREFIPPANGSGAYLQFDDGWERM